MALPLPREEKQLSDDDASEWLRNASEKNAQKLAQKNRFKWLDLLRNLPSRLDALLLTVELLACVCRVVARLESCRGDA